MRKGEESRGQRSGAARVRLADLSFNYLPAHPAPGKGPITFLQYNGGFIPSTSDNNWGGGHFGRCQKHPGESTLLLHLLQSPRAGLFREGRREGRRGLTPEARSQLSPSQSQGKYSGHEEQKLQLDFSRSGTNTAQVGGREVPAERGVVTGSSQLRGTTPR